MTTNPDLNRYEEDALLRNDFSDAVCNYQHRNKVSLEVAKQQVKKAALSVGLVTPEAANVTFWGYCDNLPRLRGTTVTIPKGTPITHRGVTKPAGRTYKVKVDYVGCGQLRHRNYHNEVCESKNPEIEWVGAGGYPSTCDINNVPEVLEIIKSRQHIEAGNLAAAE